MSMSKYESLGYLLDGIAGKDNKEKKIDIIKSLDFSRLAHTDLRRNLETIPIIETELFEQVSVIVLVKLLWYLIPLKVLESPDPDFRKIAFEICTNDLGITNPEKSFVAKIVTIFKNIRNYHRNGREATSLDLSRKDHDCLLKDQNGRCSNCFYKFKSGDIDLSYERDSDLLYDSASISDEEVVIEKLSRKPELDHIIPQFIGGDKPSNWQILCQSCNSGKSASLAWMFRPGWEGLSRISEGLKITSSMRYMVIARDGFCKNPDCKFPKGSKELRIKKINNQKMVFIENLQSFCEGCFNESLIRSDT